MSIPISEAMTCAQRFLMPGPMTAPWRQSKVLQEPRVQLGNGLNRTKGIPTSVPTARRQSSKVSCAAGLARPGGELYVGVVDE
jgi:hypothetical protein